MTCNNATCLARPEKIEECKYWNGEKCKLKKIRTYGPYGYVLWQKKTEMVES